MPDPREITIVEQPGGTAGPEHERGRQVKHNEVVIFRVEKGAKGVRIVFDNESPFGQREVGYDNPLTVDVKHKPGGNNIYSYDCTMVKNGRTLHRGGGGELEIVPGET